jgi:uncharacterized protein DUF1259
MRIIVALLALTPLCAATAQTTAWDSAATILKTQHLSTGGYHRYNFPRRDITLHVGDANVAVPLALGSWVGMSGTPARAMAMGDLVVTTAELQPLLAELQKQGVGVMAMHDHLVGEDPRLTYVHFHVTGKATDIASKLDAALSRTATPRPPAAASPARLTIDTARVFSALGIRGNASGNVASPSVVLVPGKVTMHGQTLVPAMAYGTPINVQMVDSSRVLANGDFAVLERKVQPVIDALAAHGITVTAVHNHLVGSQPTIYYIHFWKDGPMGETLSGLRAALDAAR